MNDDNYLLDAITRLTLPHTTKVTQTNDAGISCTSEVKHEPLLRLLRDAVSAFGGSAGSTAAREKIPINSAIFEMFRKIEGQVNAWYLALPTTPEHLHIWTRLGRWYVDFENRRRGGKVPADVERETENLILGWARKIEGCFDPPSRRDITSPCPVCGAVRAVDPDTGNLRAAVIVEYRDWGTDTLDKALASCGACGEEWRGRTRLRELMWLIEQETVPTPVESTAKSPSRGCVSCYRSRHVDFPDRDERERCACACHETNEGRAAA